MAQWNSPAQMSHVNNEIRKASVSSEMEDTEGTRLADALFINLRSEIGYYHRHGGGVSISVIKPIIYVEKLYRDRGGGFRTTNKKKRDGRMFYRITTSFQLQAAIIDFEDEYVVSILTLRISDLEAPRLLMTTLVVISFKMIGHIKG